MTPAGTNLLLAHADAAPAPADVVTKSLRVETDAYISFTPSSATTTRTKAVINFWFKLAEPQAGSGRYLVMFSAGKVQGAGTVWAGITYAAHTGVIHVSNEMGVAAGVATNAVFRDYGAWYNLHLIADTTAAETDRWKLYINGVLQTLTGTFPALDSNLRIGDDEPHRFSYQDNPGYHGTTFGIQAYIANAYLLENSTLPYTTFVEEDATTGQLKPKATSGLTFGTNGFHLDFEDDTAIGNDVSGNDNDFTATNLSTWDVVEDTPTENYAVLNVLASTSAGTASATASEGNLQLTWSGGTGSYILPSTIGFSSGKFYYEAYINNTYGLGADVGIGVANESADPNSGLGDDTNSLYLNSDGTIYTNSTSVSYGGSWENGDVLGVAVDADTGKVWYSVNDTWQGSPTAGTGEAVTLSGNTFFAAVRAYAYKFTANFGQDPFFAGGKTSGQDTSQSEFYYEPPSGFVALSAANLPTPAIKKGVTGFDTKIYDDGVGAKTFDNGTVSMQPDLVWAKSRGSSNDHKLTDSVRGEQNSLESNTINTEVAESSNVGVMSFDADGFTIGSSSSTTGPYADQTGDGMVAWCWKAGTSFEAESGVSGSGSKNPTAGFSIATWTGDDTDWSGSMQTINHGLGVVPEMIIAKGRTDNNGFGGGGWLVHHKDLSSEYYLLLNATDSEEYSGSDLLDNIGTTSADFGTDGSFLNFNFGGDDTMPVDADTYVAYFFASVAGYSKVGSYTGNGSADGPFVYCGFRPAYILIKRRTYNDQWHIHDTARNTYNLADADLEASTSSAEDDSYNQMDILSSGFKLRSANTGTNASSNPDYIFYAVAESPLKYASAR